jgi:para-aminobenzoate synthetase/4-amino-4-deoxychorismate lyase
MLVIAGRPVELDAHIERLSTSVAALYGKALPGEARGLVVERALGIEHGKVRLTVIPGRGTLLLRTAAEEIDPAIVFPGPERAISLRGVIVAGGLGEHKWADRELLDRATVAVAPGALPLLLDRDGAVLEVSRASVFAIRGERLLTPPADGRILPSIARRQAIEVAISAGIETHETRLDLAELRASEVFLTGSVRGIEPVGAIDGGPLPPPGAVSARIAAGLRDRWLRAAREEPAAVGAGGQPADPPGR